jgi:hypothetical protein
MLWTWRNFGVNIDSTAGDIYKLDLEKTQIGQNFSHSFLWDHSFCTWNSSALHMKFNAS